MQKLAALSPWASNPVNTSGRSNPIEAIAGPSSKPSLPSKQSPRFNINIANRSQAGNFDYENLRIPDPSMLRRKALQANPFYKPSNETLEQPSPRYQTLGNYLKKFPPVPAGVPFRVVPSVRKNGKIDHEESLRRYTKLLNTNGYDADPIAEGNRSVALSDGPIYHVEGKDAADWLYNRRGLKLTPDMWNRAAKARANSTSQLGPLPTSVYFAWSPASNSNTAFNGEETNNQHLNRYNHKTVDEAYTAADNLDEINGYTQRDYDGQLFEPWQRLMNFQDMQDHELSHAFNYLPAYKHTRQSGTGYTGKEGIDNIFFSTSNDRNKPQYTKEQTENRRKKYSNMFDNTYFGYHGGVSEYIGAMSRVKRYGKELGFDTFNSNHKKAREAMSQTLRYLAAHPNPKELTSEQQRIHSWLNTAVKNYRYVDPEYKTLSEKLENAQSEGELREYATKRKQLMDSYKYDANSPFYKDVLDFMTDSTLQGLVNNNPNMQSLNNIHLT